MIIPSIDLQHGQTVQLIGGKEKALDAGDPRPIATSFGRVGEIAVIDLDAAMGTGDNQALIQDVLPLARCRVGGGIRSVEKAKEWLNAGAAKVILGTAARPELLSQLPKERVIAALDAVHGEVVVEGWQQKTGETVLDKLIELRPYVGGFLVTFVEREGQMTGIDLDAIRALKEAAGDAKLTVAGGVATAEEIGQLDQMGVDAQVGMALYTGAFSLADSLAACLTSDRADGLWPTVITDEHGVALGLAYSNQESLQAALTRGQGVYHSRKRGLWVKGESSGATQTLHHVDLDCDRDTLRFMVSQSTPGFCHLDTWSCWGETNGLPALARTLQARAKQAPEGSYTQRLLQEDGLLHAKLLEEANELIQANTQQEICHEAADVIYFTMVSMIKAGLSLADIERELDKRSLKVTRRPGNRKDQPKEPS